VSAHETPDIETIAAKIAEDVLFPRALETDVADSVPVDNLDALAAAGFYGIFAPPEAGGLGADVAQMCMVVERLAAGCLATTFIWIQHFGLLGSLLGAPEQLRGEWLAAASRGERRGGIAFGGLLPGPPLLTAQPQGEGWQLDGVAPWVTGWGRIDTLHVAARGPDDTIVHAAIDAVEGHGLSISRQRLVAVDATNTVRVEFGGVEVPAGRVMRVAPFDPAASGGTSLRLNGSLALGVARRCCALIGPSRLDAELDECRRELDEADAAGMARARARASAFAVHAGAALIAFDGSRSILRGEHGQRLSREAAFLLVFGSRPEIRAGLLGQLGVT
jgi:alkylation response protein AidB-like acyl-CoA dehydrogenase